MDIIGIIEDLIPALPAPPWVGPPLPIAWGIRWPAKKEPEVEEKPPGGEIIWGPGFSLAPRKYVTRVTVRKARKGS